MKTNLIPVLFNTPYKKFKAHLELPDNNRIIFSGIYGIGKTTFLRHFFDRQEVKETYNCIHLFPVNYSILENEDIFKYIKYDIIYELINKFDLNFSNEYASITKSLPVFLRESWQKTLAALLLVHPKLGGRRAFKLMEELQKMYSDFIEVRKKEGGHEKEHLLEFQEAFKLVEGQIYESNIITEIIINALNKLVPKDSEMKNILVIDDLDRIDPHHIFRLFNVFAAHFDQKQQSERHNKFGFDQVVFVCDLQNIRSIFNSIYGLETDFNGYIDKFYSQKVFKFDNTSSLINLVRNQIYNDLISEKYDSINDQQILGWYNSVTEDYLRYILEKLIGTNLLNLRVLLRFYQRGKTHMNRKVLSLNKEKRTQNNQFKLIVLTDILIELFGNYSYVFEVIDKCSERVELNFTPEFYDELIGETSLLLDYRNHSFTEINNQGKTLHFTYNKVKIGYHVKSWYSKYTSEAKTYYGTLSGTKITSAKVNFFTLYKELLGLLNSLGYFKSL